VLLLITQSCFKANIIELREHLPHL